MRLSNSYSPSEGDTTAVRHGSWTCTIWHRQCCIKLDAKNAACCALFPSACTSTETEFLF